MGTPLRNQESAGGALGMKAKKFDAVQMMREIRDRLSKRYGEDPEAEQRDLQTIKRKYGMKG
jgi:hypothetical protein